MMNNLEEALHSRVSGATDRCEAALALNYDVPVMVKGNRMLLPFVADSTNDY